MPVSTPNGYLDFTNATPRATKVIATSNVGVGFNDPLHALDVAGTANVGALTATSVGVPDLTLATLAANLVTYDSSTGIFQDSGGLFSNKLAVVSEQPPSALGGASTTVEKHGVYKVTASTGTPQNAFDKATGTSWVGSSSYTGGSGTGVYVGSTTLATGLKQGDWLAVEFPYKATLRHLTFTVADTPTGALPNKANLYATNDSLVWTELKNWESNENTIVVNATEAYKKFALVTTKTRDSNSTLEIGQLKLFCESFSVDGGKIEMATSAITGGETVVEQTTAHDREPAVLKKYPEVAFADGKFEYNHSTNTYTQGGYTVSASSDQSQYNLEAWRAFDGNTTAADSWASQDGTYYDGTSPTNSYTGTTHQLGTGTAYGEWLKLELPNKIKVSKVVIKADPGSPYGTNEAPKSYKIYGSVSGSSWSELKDVSNETPSIPGNSHDITDTTYYKYIAIVVTQVNTDQDNIRIGQLEYYGYEETNTTGDLSLDTTITSKYNTPDLTSASLYLDGLKGSTATDYSGNELTVTENNVTWDSTEKSWTLSGAATSNIVSGDLGLEGDHPHSVSAWVKADVLNGDGLFHLGTSEGEGDAASRVGFVDDSHISWGGEDHYFSNAEWHNVTYTYNGEGSDKKLYLDGRLVGTAANEDTFGDYPPFAMSDYSQYGYTVSSSGNSGTSGDTRVWLAFNDSTSDFYGFGAHYNSSTGDYTRSPSSKLATTDVDGNSIPDGEFLTLELPYKLTLQYINMASRTSQTNSAPRLWRMYGSNDNINWKLLHNKTASTVPSDTSGTNYTINASKGYKYLTLVVTQNGGYNYCNIAQLKYYGHRENDLVRFPDPTNVLKYPHVAMTGPAQRGYVHTGSSEHSSSTFAGYQGIRNAYVFDDDPVTFWHAETNDGTNNQRYNGTDYLYSGINSLGGISGEWLKLQLPHKITLTRVHLRARSGQENQAPEDFTIIGSNDDSSWTTIQAFTGESPQDDGTSYYDITSSPAAYKYLAIVIQRLVGTTAASLATLEFYGTEEDADVVARVGDGLDGKVRNLRVFSTALSDDRVQEIFDADKDEFGLAKSSVSVYRGHLGIGTTEPKAALTVMDEVGELEEFPPRAMTDYETYMEGHGVFRATSSPIYNNSYPSYKAFDKNVPYNTTTNQWVSQGGTYDGASPNSFPVTSGNVVLFNGTLGSWIQLEMPYKIILKEMRSFIRVNRNYEHPTSGILYGSNDGGNTYERVYTFDDVEVSDVLSQPVVHRVNLTKAYSTFAFQITKLYGVRTFTILGELKFFGTREQGASTLHNGELTLTRNLTVPRIGPALDADDTPRRDRLVVEYNTFENPTENGVVKDTSGRGLDGFMYGAYYDATEKALRFDGTDDYIKTGTIHGPNGAWPHSISLWFRADGETSETWDYLCQFGTNVSVKSTVVGIRNEIISFGTYSYARYDSGLSIENNTWYHVVAIYPGGDFFDNAQIYVNGVLYGNSGGYDSQSISFDSSGNFLMLGNRMALSDSEFGGYISNFKLYDTALTADEVKTLYDMGRHGNVIAQPLYITAPLHAPGVPIQVVTKQVHDRVAYSAADLIHISALDFSITPKFANSKIKIEWNVSFEVGHDNVFRIYRDGTLIGYNYDAGSSHHWSGVAVTPYDNNTDSTPAHIHIVWVDTPNTTSPITYKLYKKDASGSTFDAFYLNRPKGTGGSNNNESGVSHAIVTEIAQ